MSNIQTEQRDGVFVITLARPEKKNALTTEMYADLRAALDTARDEEDMRAVVLAGGPGMFTAGNDLMDFLQQPPTSEESPVFQFLVALVEFPKPVVAAVDGAADRDRHHDAAALRHRRGDRAGAIRAAVREARAGSRSRVEPAAAAAVGLSPRR